VLYKTQFVNMNSGSSRKSGVDNLKRLLQSFLTEAEILILAEDYANCEGGGGNIELGFAREEEISHRPRLERLLSILVRDGGVTDIQTLRTVLYAALPKTSEAVSPAQISLPHIREELAKLRAGRHVPLQVGAVGLALELDVVRHLHMRSDAHNVRRDVCAEAMCMLAAVEAEPSLRLLRRKVAQAVRLQERYAGGQDPAGTQEADEQ